MHPIRIVGLGDSHLEPLETAARIGLLQVDSYTFVIVPGATAVGLRNPNSKTDALKIFKERVLREPKDIGIVLHLGEVDCGFVIWFRAEKYHESVETQMEESLHSYMQFVSELVNMGYKHICLTGATIPTIRDGIDWGEVANARSGIKVDIQKRTALTLEYNKNLRAFAQSKGLYYFEMTDVVMNPKTGVVHDFYRHVDMTDHHLDPNKVIPIWAMKCNKFINSMKVIK